MNQWSGGEYNNNIEDFSISMIRAAVSNRASSKGNFSFRAWPITDEGYLNINVTLEDITGENATLTFDYSSGSSTVANLIQTDSNNQELSRISTTLNPTNGFAPITLTSALDNDCTKLIIRIKVVSVIFIDNISLKIQ